MRTPAARLPRPASAALGILLDQLAGEPPAALHPVVHFGRAMEGAEKELYRDGVVAGLAHTAVGVALGITGGVLVGSTAVATALAVGGRALAHAAQDVGSALAAGDEDRARSLLPALVGRDTTQLTTAEMARATVESVAENTVDAIVAPALWAAVAGAPGALGYRAVNTMDAMVGHHSDRYDRYGRASARLDDAANWVPARCTAALVALVRPRAARAIRRAVAIQAPSHPSPNAGVAEAAFAAALGIRLGGTNRYGDRIEERPQLGHGREAEAEDITRAVRLCRDVATALAVTLGLAGMARWRTGR